jgi:DNA topoisomerase-1
MIDISALRQSGGGRQASLMTSESQLGRPRLLHGIAVARRIGRLKGFVPTILLAMRKLEPVPKESPVFERNKEVAKEAGLRYSDETSPGISRERSGPRFEYFANGSRIRNRAVLHRIERLAIPPAWTEVWICPSEDGHLQATGRDGKGRKQYRYHEDWRAVRDANKFEHMIDFAKALPSIRRRIRRDLALSGMPRDKVLATIVRLLEVTLIRVGNDEYARANGSYGLATMKNRHAKINGNKVAFRFKGKSGVTHDISVHDPTLAKIVRKCQHMPGQELFTYQDESGKTRDVRSEDVNEYLREISHADITAKDFRTWSGTVLAAIALRELENLQGVKRSNTEVKTAVIAVAKVLGNTAAVCRKCYIHPTIIDGYLSGKLIETSPSGESKRGLTGLKPDEKAVLALLKRAARDHSKQPLAA